ncbi:hypothetical protein P3H78_33035, partial [Streptomyces sp. K1PA1]|nr:hypothetical protein [Streptomyces tropicalis]
MTASAEQTLRAVEAVIGRHSGRHTVQPAHHALRLVEQAAERLAEHLVPDRLRTTGATYPDKELQQDQDGITALAYLLDHLPFDDNMPAEAGHDLEAALRLCTGHRDVGGLAGEMHRHQKVADAAKTVLNNSGPQRGFFALALHNLARHHVDRLASHLPTLPADGAAARRATAPDGPADQSVTVPPGAQPYADAAHGRAAQDDLLELVRAAVLEGPRPLTHGPAPIVLAHLMQARDHGVVYSDHQALAAFAGQGREQAHLHRLDKTGDGGALEAAARAAEAHAGALAATEPRTMPSSPSTPNPAPNPRLPGRRRPTGCTAPRGSTTCPPSRSPCSPTSSPAVGETSWATGRSPPGGRRFKPPARPPSPRHYGASSPAARCAGRSPRSATGAPRCWTRSNRSWPWTRSARSWPARTPAT